MSDVYRLLVTGSRSWTADTETDGGRTLEDILDSYAATAAQAGFLGLRVVHGACYPARDDVTGIRPGESADWLAEVWVRDRKRRGWPVTSEPHPAAWKRWRKTAGHRRNADMVSLGAHRCVAFVDTCFREPAECGPYPHDSHGATHCADLAEKAGIPTERFRPTTGARDHRNQQHQTKVE